MSQSTRLLFVLGLSLAILPFAGCGGGGGAASNDPDVAVDLIVQRVLPTNGQEVANDLTDVNGIIEVKFSEQLKPETVLDPSNAFNGLSSDVNVLDSVFARVRGTPSIVGDRGNILQFVPAGGQLPNGQYTVTCTRDVQNYAGGRLNNGLFDFKGSFTVGTDIYSPVIRTTFPVPNQDEISKTSQIIVTFNESLDESTVTQTSFLVQDGGTAPPTTIPGTLTMGRDNFDIVWTPFNPMPPNTTVVVTVTGGAAGINDKVGNPFEGDPTTPPVYQFQFKTVTEPPWPLNPWPVAAGIPSGAVYYANKDSVGTVDETWFATNVLAGERELSNWAYDTQLTAVPQALNPVQYSETKIGRPGELMLDPRLDPITGFTWLYAIDKAKRDIVVLDTFNSQLMTRWPNIGDPRGLSIEPASNGTLYVSDFANRSLSFVNIAPSAYPLVQVNATDPSNRKDIIVGEGPIGVGIAIGAGLVFTANSVGNSCTVVNGGTATISTSFSTGAMPKQVEGTAFINPVGYFAFITCLGGPGQEDGSVALWWSAPNGLQANITGFKNPDGAMYDRGISCWIANSGGDTISRLTLAVSGGGFASTILPQIDATITVGKNPSDVTIDPLMLALRQPPVVIAAVPGSGTLTFGDTAEPWRPVFSIPIPGVQRCASYWDY